MLQLLPKYTCRFQIICFQILVNLFGSQWTPMDPEAPYPTENYESWAILIETEKNLFSILTN